MADFFIIDVVLMQDTNNFNVPSLEKFLKWKELGTNHALFNTKTKYQFLSKTIYDRNEFVLCVTKFGLKFGFVVDCNHVEDNTELPTSFILFGTGASTRNMIRNQKECFNKIENSKNLASKFRKIAKNSVKNTYYTVDSIIHLCERKAKKGLFSVTLTDDEIHNSLCNGYLYENYINILQQYGFRIVVNNGYITISW